MSFRQKGRRQTAQQERAERFVSLIAEGLPRGAWVILTTREVCALLDCSRNTVHRMVALLLAQGRIERDYAYDRIEPMTCIGLKFRLPPART